MASKSEREQERPFSTILDRGGDRVNVHSSRTSKRQIHSSYA